MEDNAQKKSIAQIADEIGVSRQAIHRKIKGEQLSTALQEHMSTIGRTIYISVDGENLIKKAFFENIPSASSTLSTEPDRKSDKGKGEHFDDIIAILKQQNENIQRTMDEQIKILQEQLKAKDEQIKMLQETLQQSQQNINQAQQLNALDKRQEIEKKPKGLKRLFSRKKRDDD